MNKNQLLVMWGMVILVCLIIFFPPKFNTGRTRYGRSVYKTDWDRVAQYCIPCMLVGGLLIYTLKNKK